MYFDKAEASESIRLTLCFDGDEESEAECIRPDRLEDFLGLCVGDLQSEADVVSFVSELA
jgi:hypothetical protein